MFALMFQTGENDPTRKYFDESYMSLVEIKDFTVLIDNKPFFDQLVKNKQDAYEKRIEMSRNDDYVTGNLSYYTYHQNYYKLIDIYLPGQTKIMQKFHNFMQKLEENNNGATLFFISEKQDKTILKFSFDSLNIRN